MKSLATNLALTVSPFSPCAGSALTHLQSTALSPLPLYLSIQCLPTSLITLIFNCLPIYLLHSYCYRNILKGKSYIWFIFFSP